MQVSIMVVEDNDAIRAGYKRFLIDEAKELDIIAYVEDFANYDGAIKRLLDKNKPTFDLFFTDIDLTGSPNPDKAGIYFAKYAKKTLPDVPVIGRSGYFNDADLSMDEKQYFDKWWPKGSSFADLDEMLKDTIERAIESKKKRMSSEQSLTIQTPETDEHFQNAGYRQESISPNQENSFIKPFSIWVRESDEGCELEVVGCPALIAWGDDLGQAIEVLEELINGYRELLDVPDEYLSPSMWQARDFIKQIIGSPVDAKEPI